MRYFIIVYFNHAGNQLSIMGLTEVTYPTLQEISARTNGGVPVNIMELNANDFYQFVGGSPDKAGLH